MENCKQFIHVGCLECTDGVGKCTTCEMDTGTCEVCVLENTLACKMFRDEWEALHDTPFVCLEADCYACCHYTDGECDINGLPK